MVKEKVSRYPGGSQRLQDGRRTEKQEACSGAGDPKAASSMWWDSRDGTPTKSTATKLSRFQGKDRITGRLLVSDAHLETPERRNRDPSAQDLCREADTVLRTRDVKRAQKLLEKAVSMDPACVQAWCNLGLLLQSWYRDAAGAMQHYEQALALNPSHADSLCNYGLLHLTMGAPFFSATEAEAFFKRCLEVDATHADALCNYGLLKHQVAREPAAAEALFRTALAQNPSHVHSLFNLANLMREGNRIPEAVELYKHVIAIEPTNIDCMCNLAILEQVPRHTHNTQMHADMRAHARCMCG
jgi:Tfp pilus assembly protein PilF